MTTIFAEDVAMSVIDDKKLKWIPWQRYVFILNIDGKDYFSGRHRRKERIQRDREDLRVFLGYTPRIVDTKPKKKEALN
jgi:hypothetical protein